MATKANAQKEAIKWLIDVGGTAEFVDNDNALRAPNNSFYYANRSFWKAIEAVEFCDNDDTIRIK